MKDDKPQNREEECPPMAGDWEAATTRNCQKWADSFKHQSREPEPPVPPFEDMRSTATPIHQAMLELVAARQIFGVTQDFQSYVESHQAERDLRRWKCIEDFDGHLILTPRGEMLLTALWRDRRKP